MTEPSSTKKEAIHWATTLRRRVILALLAAVAIALPFGEGVLISGWVAAVMLLPLGWFLLARSHVRLLENVLVCIMALCVTVPAVDLLLRPLIGPHLHFTPTNMFTRRLPELPMLGRFDAGVSYVGPGYGDLAAHAGDPRVREPRRIAVITDEAGFRNDQDGRDRLDALIVGDSFVAGWGTTQERLFSTLLQTRYGKRTYNLGFPASPWEEYMNVLLESSRLAFTADAHLIWALYTGNDLFEPYRDIWDPALLPRNGKFGAWMQRFRTFRARSPLRQMIRHFSSRVGTQTVDVIRRELPDGRPILFTSMNNELALLSRAEVEQHPNYPLLEQTMSAMGRAASAQRLRLTVIIIPTKQEVYRWILEQRMSRSDDTRSSGFAVAVLAACERLKLSCLDTKPFLSEEAQALFASTGELLWWRDDTHLGDRGHEAIAAFIARHVFEISDAGQIASPADSHNAFRGMNVP